MTAHASHAADFPGTLPQSPFFNLSWDLAHCALVISLRGDLRATLSLGALQALKALFSALDLQNKVRHIVLRSESPEVFGGALDVDEIDDLAASAERLFGGDVIIEPEIQERALVWLPDEMRFAAPESGEELTSPDNSEHDLADMVNKEGGNEGDQSFAQAA